MPWILPADTSGVTGGQGLIYDAARNLFVPADLAGGVDVSDDGTPVVSPATLLNFGAGLSVTDDGGGAVTIDATGGGGGGGSGVGPIWSRDDVAASLTDSPLTLFDGVRTTVPAPCAGTISCITVRTNEARTAGTLTVEVTVNGVGTGLTATLDGTNDECHSATGSVNVAECDEIGIAVTTDGSWLPTSADITAAIQWGGPGGGGGGGVTTIAQQVVGAGGAASVTFSSIPGTFEDLEVVALCRSDPATDAQQILARFNGDTGTNYNVQVITGNATALTGARATGATSLQIGAVTAGNNTSGVAAAVRLLIPAYARTVFNKSTIVTNTYWISTTGPVARTAHGVWRSTAAITDITIFPAAGNLVEGSVFTLRGFAG